MRISAPVWYQNPVVIERLLATPERFEFLQALRLLEAGGESIGRFNSPLREALRFEQEVSFGFHGSEIQSIALPTEGRAIVRTAFMGLTGADGVLPFHYTEQLLARIKAKDYALKHWLDIFHHRALSLYFRAGTWARAPAQVAHTPACPQRRASRALAGASAASAALASYRVKPGISIGREASARFGVQVQVRDFVGRWETFDPDFRLRLGGGAQLGRGAVLGGKALLAQSGVEVQVGPLDAASAARFAPTAPATAALQRFVAQAAGGDAEVTMNLRLTADPAPTRLVKAAAPALGWNARLGGRTRGGEYQVRLKPASPALGS